MCREPNESIEHVYLIMFAPPMNPFMPYNHNAYLNREDAKKDYQQATDNCRIDYTRFMIQEFTIVKS